MKIDLSKVKQVTEDDECITVHFPTTLLTNVFYKDSHQHCICLSREWREDLVVALMRNHSLTQSILIAALACQNCRKQLAHDLGLSWGEEQDPRYTIGSCVFCEEAKTQPKKKKVEGKPGDPIL